MDAVSTGSATKPEPMMPIANNTGPQGPTAGVSASAACLVVMSTGWGRCSTALAAIMIDDAKTNAITVAMVESAWSCSCPGSARELACQMMMYGVSIDPKIAT